VAFGNVAKCHTFSNLWYNATFTFYVWIRSERLLVIYKPFWFFVKRQEELEAKGEREFHGSYLCWAHYCKPILDCYNFVLMLYSLLHIRLLAISERSVGTSAIFSCSAVGVAVSSLSPAAGGAGACLPDSRSTDRTPPWHVLPAAIVKWWSDVGIYSERYKTKAVKYVWRSTARGLGQLCETVLHGSLRDKCYTHSLQVYYTDFCWCWYAQCGLMTVVAIAPIPAQCAGDFNPDPAHRSA